MARLKSFAFFVPPCISQYPKWLEDNKDNANVTADMNNYRLQHTLIGAIIGEFDAEKESDTDEIKSKRFEKIMDLMQQVCTCSFLPYPTGISA